MGVLHALLFSLSGRLILGLERQPDPRTRIITTLEAVPAGTNGGCPQPGLWLPLGALLISVVSTLLGP